MAREEESRMPDGAGSNKPHILVIEDNPADVDLLRYALQEANVDCEVTVIDDGGDALALTRRQGKFAGMPAPDLVILDLNLPKNDGIEILEAMRRSVPFADVPIAVLSSSSSPRERAKIEKFAVCRFITKPPYLDEFLAIGTAIKELLADAGSGETDRVNPGGASS
jgi:two-component system response regulator